MRECPCCGDYLYPDDDIHCEECIMEPKLLWLAVPLLVLGYPVWRFACFMREAAAAARRRNEAKRDRRAMREMGL